MTEAVTALPHGSGHAGHHDDGSKTVFGFWIYLMSDLLIFSVLFATFAVLSKATAGGPSGAELFDLSFVLVETMLLLISSFTFGMRSEEHTSELQSLMRISYAVFCLHKKIIIISIK